MVDQPGIYLKVWNNLDSFYIIRPEEEPRLNAAVSRWVDSGQTRDTLLDLSRIDGAVYYILVSTITSWTICTPEGRLNDWKWEKGMADETDEHKQQVGLAWENND